MSIEEQYDLHCETIAWLIVETNKAQQLPEPERSKRANELLARLTFADREFTKFVRHHA